MKGSSMTTHMGNITIDNEVIGQYAGTVAMECFGIVGMGATVKGGLVKLLKSDSITKGIAVTLNNNKVEAFTGMEIEKINIFVEGVRVID